MKEHTFAPVCFMILPTMACQASCKYCFAKKTGEVMSDAVAEKTIAFIARIAPKDKDIHITFHGGEPLLAGAAWYERVLPRLRAAFGRRAHLSIQSNLWALDERMTGLFREYRVGVGTSLDGDEAMCREQRGEGYYERTKAAEATLLEHGIPVSEICTFAAPNAHRAAEIFRASNGAYALHGAVPSYRMPPDGQSVSAEQMERILLDSYTAYREAPERGRITTIDAMAKGFLKGEGCTCTFFDCLGAFAAIAPDGGVYTCQRFCGYDEFLIGNVLDDCGEADILSSAGYARLRGAEDGKREACGDCAHWEYCRGGCLYNAVTAGADRDPYCEAYRAAFDRIGCDMALEMGAVMLGREGPTPTLAMAGETAHPYDTRVRAAALKRALENGKKPGNAYPNAHHFLNKLYLHLTFDCPLRCDHCYADGGHRKSDPLPPETFARVLSDAADAGFASAVITGGEPLVYPGFRELLRAMERMDRKGMKLILRSSFGFEIPPELLERILAAFDSVIVSVDGNETTHDARRGIGRYAKTAENLRRASELGMGGKVGLCCTLSAVENSGAPGRSVTALAEKLGLSGVRFRPVLPLGRGAGARQDALQTPCESETEFADHFRPRTGCGLGSNLYVEPDGKVFPCYAWAEKDKQLGSLSVESLTGILARGELREYTKHGVDANAKCKNCEVRYLCGGMCRARVRDRSDVDSGDFDCSARKAFYTRLAEKISKE